MPDDQILVAAEKAGFAVAAASIPAHIGRCGTIKSKRSLTCSPCPTRLGAESLDPPGASCWIVRPATDLDTRQRP